MVYSVKEIFYSLQGEGFHSGRPSVFCRFSGCNLWSGREEDRATAACPFCDTDFVGTDGSFGAKYMTASDLANVILAQWPSHDTGHRFVVFTGGEPLLQLDQELIAVMHQHHFYVAIETNGTLDVPKGVDWVCMSPKAGVPLILTSGDELKVVVPQPALVMKDLEKLNFKYFFVQPMDGIGHEDNTQFALTYCLQNPKWNLSLQTHKIIGVQ